MRVMDYNVSACDTFQVDSSSKVFLTGLDFALIQLYSPNKDIRDAQE